jgi:beta-ribofuranosylaminobenzene 5'-phosphate synthase
VKVYVKTPARLHLGLIDLNGDLGRIFGGLGVGISRPNVILEAQQSERFTVKGEKAEAVKALAKRFFEDYHIQPNVSLFVKQTIPEHVGLGSGTQLALAVAVALAKLSNVKASTQELAIVMGRGQRTGVGTAIFQHGGLVVDGGKIMKNGSSLLKFPPLILRKPFPEHWHFVVVIPNTSKGLTGDDEKLAFNQTPQMPSEDVGNICRLIIMKLLPALIDCDIKSFGDALTQIQMIVGENFSDVQGGRYFRSTIAEGVEFMRKLGAYGVGQSSWGPVFYGLFQRKEAEEAQRNVQAYLGKSAGGAVFIAKANNRGAYIKLLK